MLLHSVHTPVVLNIGGSIDRAQKPSIYNRLRCVTVISNRIEGCVFQIISPALLFPGHAHLDTGHLAISEACPIDRFLDTVRNPIFLAASVVGYMCPGEGARAHRLAMGLDDLDVIEVGLPVLHAPGVVRCIPTKQTTLHTNMILFPVVKRFDVRRCWAATRGGTDQRGQQCHQAGDLTLGARTTSCWLVSPLHVLEPLKGHAGWRVIFHK